MQQLGRTPFTKRSEVAEAGAEHAGYPEAMPGHGRVPVKMPTRLAVSAATHVFPHQRACKSDRRDPGVWRRAVGPGQGCSRGKHNARLHNS